MKSLKVDKLLITHQQFNLSTFKQKQAKLAFTMAEILLSLTIIGVVAAITLPSLTGNINERVWNTQKKALYSRMTQAIALMPALNGYGKLSATVDGSGSAVITEDTAAETFVTSGLSKVMKINNICSSTNLADCGLTSQFLAPNGSKITMPKTAKEFNIKLTSGVDPVYSHLNTNTVGFETGNGESIDLIYILDCKPSKNETSKYLTQEKLCLLMIYDLNGKKGPNTVGKDVGLISVFYPSDPVVSLVQAAIRPSPEPVDDYDAAVKYCKDLGEDYRLPNKEEAAAMAYSAHMYKTGNGLIWTTSTLVDGGTVKHWVQGLGGDTAPYPKNKSTFRSWCVQR